MIRIRRSEDRGHAEHGWLDTRHTFSFAGYHDPAHHHFRALRVINEDRVRPGTGFGRHGHRDMEILTWVLSGTLEHRDSMGNGAILRPGEIQRMTAGTGIEHSEWNPSDAEVLHLLQIWILPSERGLPPSWEQSAVGLDDRRNRLVPVAAPEGEEAAVHLHQDARLRIAVLDSDREVRWPIEAGRHAWVQVARGRVHAREAAPSPENIELHAGDGAAYVDEPEVVLRAAVPSEVLVFDLA